MTGVGGGAGGRGDAERAGRERLGRRGGGSGRGGGYHRDGCGCVHLGCPGCQARTGALAGGVSGPGLLGGGKIRQRLCHQGPLKPYQQGPAQCHLLLSDLAQSLQHLLPRWLPTYFRKDQDAPSCCTDTREEPLGSETSHDRPMGVDPGRSKVNDALGSPEPAVGETEAPHTSNTAASDTPPMGSCAEGRAPPSQDRHTAASSCAARAPDKEGADSHSPPLPPLGTPQAECAHSVSQHSSATSEPAPMLGGCGNLSTSLPHFPNRKTGQLRQSPFPPGNTPRGAAAALRLSALRNAPYLVPVTKMRPRTRQAPADHVTSLAAHTILEYLETASSFGDVETIPPIFFIS